MSRNSNRPNDAILAADDLVIIFPPRLGTLPAILKGFLERVPDLVEPAKQGKFVKILKGKSARIIVTMRMPGFIYPMVVWGACGKNA